MNPRILGLRVAGIVFGLIALAQLGRIVARPEILVNGHVLLLWPSVVAMIAAGGLAIWCLKLSRGPSSS